MSVYRLFWEEFSAWYLEIVKPAYQQPIDRATLEATLGFFDTLLRLIHPFMPFISEELWQHLAERRDGESIMVARLPEPGEVDQTLLTQMTQAKEIISGIRSIRKAKNIANKEVMQLHVMGSLDNPFTGIIAKVANLDAIVENAEKDPTAASFLVGTLELAVPLGNNIDVAAEIEKLEGELKYAQGFLAGVEKKLANERFVANAPEAVVAMERKKKADAESKIASLTATLAALKGE